MSPTWLAGLALWSAGGLVVALSMHRHRAAAEVLRRYSLPVRYLLPGWRARIDPADHRRVAAFVRLVRVWRIWLLVPVVTLGAYVMQSFSR